MDDRRVAGDYAILSHTWGTEEVDFEEFDLEDSKTKHGFLKISGAAQQARRDRIDYLWCDTCCIDKRSSAELSEAINSMYRWYYDAKVCYAYLSDVTTDDQTEHRFGEYDLSLRTHRHLRNSRWFKRGWTLQELIAPQKVVFFDANWTPMTLKSEIADLLSDITDIDKAILLDRRRLRDASVAKRMSFAASRQTTRVEDQAYSLMGIFDVSMPLLYGEGPKAFKRLQEEIIRTWTKVDHSILAWTGSSDELLAQSPSQFPARFTRTERMMRHRMEATRRDIISWSLPQDETFELTNKGLRISLYVMPLNDKGHLAPRNHRMKSTESLVGVLNCSYRQSRNEVIGIFLHRRPWIDMRHSPSSDPVYREAYTIYEYAPPYTTVSLSDFQQQSIFKTVTIARLPYDEWPQHASIRMEIQSSYFTISHTPIGVWKWQSSTFHLNSTSDRYRSGILVLRDALHEYNGISVHIDQKVDTGGGEPVMYIGICQDHVHGYARLGEIRANENYQLQLEGRVVFYAVFRYTMVEGKVGWHLTISDASEYPSSPTLEKGGVDVVMRK